MVEQAEGGARNHPWRLGRVRRCALEARGRERLEWACPSTPDGGPAPTGLESIDLGELSGGFDLAAEHHACAPWPRGENDARVSMNSLRL